MTCLAGFGFFGDAETREKPFREGMCCGDVTMHDERVVGVDYFRSAWGLSGGSFRPKTSDPVLA